MSYYNALATNNHVLPQQHFHSITLTLIGQHLWMRTLSLNIFILDICASLVYLFNIIHFHSKKSSLEIFSARDVVESISFWHNIFVTWQCSASSFIWTSLGYNTRTVEWQNHIELWNDKIRLKDYSTCQIMFEWNLRIELCFTIACDNTPDPAKSQVIFPFAHSDRRTPYNPWSYALRPKVSCIQRCNKQGFLCLKWDTWHKFAIYLVRKLLVTACQHYSNRPKSKHPSYDAALICISPGGKEWAVFLSSPCCCAAGVFT